MNDTTTRIEGDKKITTLNAGSEQNPFPVDFVETIPAKKKLAAEDGQPISAGTPVLGIPHNPAPPVKSPSVATDKPKGPTAAESMKKQKEADKLSKLESRVEKADSTTPSKPKKEKTVTKTKPAKKTGKKPIKAAKPSTNGKKGRAPKEGLRTMQVRALKVLTSSQFKEGLPLSVLAGKAGIASVVMQRGIGTIDPSSRPSHDERNGFKSLLTKGYVRVQKREYNEETDYVFSVTAAGEAAYAKWNKENPDGLGKKHAAPFSVKKKGK